MDSASPSLRRRAATWASRVLVEPDQLLPRTLVMTVSLVTKVSR